METLRERAEEIKRAIFMIEMNDHMSKEEYQREKELEFELHDIELKMKALEEFNAKK